MTNEEQTNNKKTAPKKDNWDKAGQVAMNACIVAATAFISGLAMAAGQGVYGRFTSTSANNTNAKPGLSIVRDRAV